MLSVGQLELIKKSWERVMKRPAAFESTFSEFLIELEPGFQELYMIESASQSNPAVTMFNRVIQNIPSAEVVLKEIVTKYSGHGISCECIDKLSLAMLLTMEKLLRSGWNNTLRDTWALFISTMILTAKRRKPLKETDKVHLLR